MIKKKFRQRMSSKVNLNHKQLRTQIKRKKKEKKLEGKSIQKQIKLQLKKIRKRSRSIKLTKFRLSIPVGKIPKLHKGFMKCKRKLLFSKRRKWKGKLFNYSETAYKTQQAYEVKWKN